MLKIAHRQIAEKGNQADVKIQESPMPMGGLTVWNRLRGRVDLMHFGVNLEKIVFKAPIFEPNQKEREADMNERAGMITMRGNPLTLIGQEIKPGDPAPDFESLDNELKPVR